MLFNEDARKSAKFKDEEEKELARHDPGSFNFKDNQEINQSEDKFLDEPSLKGEKPDKIDTPQFNRSFERSRSVRNPNQDSLIMNTEEGEPYNYKKFNEDEIEDTNAVIGVYEWAVNEEVEL